LEPVSSALQGKDIRIPNTDQSVDGIEQSNILGEAVLLEATDTVSLLGHPITHVASPNFDMRLSLIDILNAANAGDVPAMNQASNELRNILMGTTQGRIYDGYAMLNFNRWHQPQIGPEFFPADAVPGEYKMKIAVDSGETYTSPYDGEERKIWTADVSMFYYDGQIDSDTYLLKFPFGHHPDDILHVNYTIYSMVQEDFSPTLVMLDRREADDTVNFPFKGIDSVWIAMDPGQVLKVTLKYPPIRQIRGVYTWGWRVHPPRIQFLQPIYEIENKNTGEIELDPQGRSYAERTRDDLTLGAIASEAPEMKMWEIVKAIVDGAPPENIAAWMTDPNAGPRGNWIEWADLAEDQTQIPPEAWDMLADEDQLGLGEFGDYKMVTVYMNNEMYGEGPFQNEVAQWNQGDVFEIKLINFDNHTHYFRNVDFSTRLHDDMLRCCGGGLTSFEVMNFKPSYGAPKVAEMQWRAGWGFRPHHDILQQSQVFPRGMDRVRLKPYKGGYDGWAYGYQYSEEARGGDFRFNPPDFIINEIGDPSPFQLREFDLVDGLVLGQKTEGYGVAQMCPQDPSGDFCQTDFGPFNPHGVLNWPDPPNPNVEKTELRYPPFLRNPDQGATDGGDIIAPTAAWRPFLWINPYNGTLFNDPDKPELGYWADLTYAHGTPIKAGESLHATIELPRSAGQVFYQFDDLFHDNAIFSPHPVANGVDDTEVDEISIRRAGILGDEVVVQGIAFGFDLARGERAGWASIYSGPTLGKECSGEILGVAEVDPNNGRFEIRADATDVVPGSTLCVQSTIGAHADVIVNVHNRSSR